MTDEKLLRIILISLLVYIVSIIAAFFGGYWVGSNTDQPQVSDTTRVTVVDTISYYHPIPKDSTVLRYVTKTLPAAKPDTAASVPAQPTAHTDSVAVVLPISQKAYETEDYRAYVSGYEPNLDSIFVNRRTVKETVTIVKQKDKRLGFSVVAGAGWGIINKKPDIFVGGAIAYRVW